MDSLELACYKKVQNAARFTLEGITAFIKPGVTEAQLVQHCHTLQTQAGVEGYWYKDLAALVLVGTHTTLAISAMPYVPNDEPIQETDLVTIDLNPSLGGYCGDCARSYYVEQGMARRTPQSNPEFLAGAAAQQHLHQKLMKMARPDTTFHELNDFMQEEIKNLGFDSLDYLGHGVQKDMTRFVLLAPGVLMTLGQAGLFTLEPQLRLRGGAYGIKHENIYYFEGQELCEL
jgi:Xaa-Pro aminopeptidase